MDASDLAREIVTYNMLPDRTSPLALVVGGHLIAGSTFAVTAPIENGRQILRVIYPQRNWAKIDYDCHNLEGVAICIDAQMIARETTWIELIKQSERPRVMDDELSSWQVNDESRAIRIQEIKQILTSLLVIDHNYD